MVVWNILCHFLITFNLVEELQQGSSLWNILRHPQPQPRSPKYFTDRMTFTAHNEVVDELNTALLQSSLSGVTHMLAGHDRVVHETQERQDTMLRMLMQSMFLNSCRF